mmetsp:Transcript_11065/g.23636  ORF Transcript_11065/g.23636 Transcript_11065/m.23636 type:complete len:483 (-) Transcript_11065:361-1809(-)|eukprot:CAMPEP_0183715042 /NCGR_PEP_ID=MMETSP0737-20130205/9418_1 /TAXON_ID=385413 /ORGANISM="Thalassiosira miniscula, Strain CCMP1093" /LENGTH=482 /DNA_ID=CAMNT_0025944099 /DNA_START=54 /DNA_END=1502 /DNA_ORIENTATION=+
MWDEASFPSDSAVAVSILVVALSIGYLLVSRIYRTLKNDGKVYPLYAPGGVWKHVRMVTHRDYPWWVLETSRQLQTQVFEITLPIRLINPPRAFVVGEPKAVREIMTDPLTEKPPEINAQSEKLFAGNSVMITMNGDSWHAKRKSIAPAFSSKHVKRMSKVALEKTEAWMKDTLLNPEKETSFDVSTEMISIVLSAIVETAFEYVMLPEEQKDFDEQLEIALVEFVLKSSTNPFRGLYGYFLPERRQAFAAVQNLMKLSLKVMDEYRKKEPSNEGTIMKLIMESAAHPTDEEKAAEILAFLIAGHDTTAFSIAWVLLELARNPNEQKKLRESLSQLSPENYGRSEYLKYVVNEGMRLHPVTAAGSIRTIGRDITTSRNEVLPKGSLALMPYILMFHDPGIFEKPDVFNPSRWENPTRSMLDAFIPFSLGKQNCIGQSLAKAETVAIISKICSEFELSVEEEGTVDFFLTLKPVGARLSARKL